MLVHTVQLLLVTRLRLLGKVSEHLQLLPLHISDLQDLTTLSAYFLNVVYLHNPLSRSSFLSSTSSCQDSLFSQSK